LNICLEIERKYSWSTYEIQLFAGGTLHLKENSEGFFLENTLKDHKILQYVYNNPKVQKLGSVWSFHNNNVSSGLAVIMRIAEQLSEDSSIKIGIKYKESWLQLSPSLDIITHSIYSVR
jgi:hypothetical protein